MKRMIKILSKIYKKESGQALVVVLLILAMGSMLIAPLLSYTGSSLEVGQAYNKEADEFYAADAGIEDGLWNINNNKLPVVCTDPIEYDEFDYSTTWYYSLDEEVNGKPVEVEIENIWIPTLSKPDPYVARLIIQGTEEDPPKLVVIGKSELPTEQGDELIGNFEIKINFSPGDGEQLSLLVYDIGIWLPPGFTYIEGSSFLDNDSNADYYTEPDIIQHAGGTAVIWSLNGYPFAGDGVDLEPLPGVSPGDLEVCSISFQYVADSLQECKALSWIDTTVEGTALYTWDADVKVYHINSTATTPASGSHDSTDTEIDAYTVREELRELVDAISGDYYATGDAFLYAYGGPFSDSKYRDVMYSSGSAEVTTGGAIPENAAIVGAYLYWTGWIDNDGYDDGGGEGTILWSDDCSEYGTTTPVWDDDCDSYGTTTALWTENCSSFDDGPYTWTDSSRWSIYSGQFWAQGGYGDGTLTLAQNINLSAYSGQEVIISWDQVASYSVDYNDYLTFYISNNGGSSWYEVTRFYDDDPPSPYSYVIPDSYLTSQFRIRYEWNAGSTNEYFYIDDITISIFSGDWDPGDNWDIYNNQFRCVGSGTTNDRTLTRVTDIDLSAYTGQTVTISWEQSEYGYLSGDDQLQFYLSNDGGASWGIFETAFSDDNPSSPYEYTIPEDYLTDQFRIRFVWTGNNSYGYEYCYIDNITISIFSGDWDPGSHWEIYSYYGGTEFRCYGGGTEADQTLTHTSDITTVPPLGDFAGQTVQLSVDIYDYYSESDDILYYQFYNSSGWSSRQEIFDGYDSSGTYTVTIPEAYLTDDFQVRFFWDANSTGDYVYLDDIEIIAMGDYNGLEYTEDPVDQAVLVEENARVNTVKFGLDGWDYDDEMVDVFADSYQILQPVIINGYVDEGLGTWSYCCYADVTDLITLWIEDEDLESNGAGTYAVSNAWVDVPNEVDPSYSWNFADLPGHSTGYPLGTPADTTSNLKDQNCHSGWSLILIYSSPETAGHQLFLYDINSPGFNYTQARHTDPDFDDDGLAGGTVKGFLVPEQITGETEAGRVTVFVGEGDDFIYGDSLLINGSYMSNIANQWNNVCNSESVGLDLTGSGIDIDTFSISWASGTLVEGDVEATVNMPTDDDGIHIIYIILSFRSEVTTGGTITFLIH